MKNRQSTVGRALRAALVGAAVAGALPLALAQATGAGAVFEGRPAMAGAQGGQGAQAGMAQGGLGVQGSEGQTGVNLRKPTGLDAATPAVPRDPGVGSPGAAKGELAPRKDPGIAKEQRSGAAKARRVVKRAGERARRD